MKIGILVMFVNSFGKRGLYNSQEIGMAKELARRGHTVSIYRCVSMDENERQEQIYDNVEYVSKRVKSIGNNAISSFRWLDKNLDALICFSDVQLLVNRVYKWTKANKILFIPYVGIGHSMSGSGIRRKVINSLAHRTYSVYQKTGVWVKTKSVAKELETKGVNKIIVAPVGLDFDLLHKDYKNSQPETRRELGFNTETKYLLLVGRLEEDRNPMDALELFIKVCQMRTDYELVIIGKGSQEERLYKGFSDARLISKVRWVGQIPNKDMWKYYTACDCLISFSRVEIFGMSILEAMFYELPVYVINAPGPDDIIENGKTGYLFRTPEEMAEELSKGISKTIGINEHNRILDQFTWRTTVDIIEKALRREQ